MDKELVEKFINDTCTVEQAEEVIKWLSTEEGQVYLAKRLDEDTDLLRNEHIKPMLPEVKSGKIWNNIEKEFESTKKHKAPSRYYGSTSSYWYAAVIVLLVCGLSVFFAWKHFSVDQITESKQAVHIITNAHEHKKIMLNDGTKITLNSNSKLWVSATYGQPKREVTLKGEAYFEVNHNPAKPFVIHTQDILIKDLGTAFNVRAFPGKENVQVAVESGKVSILPHANSIVKGDATMKKAKLTAGQYAYVNLKTNLISVNEFEVSNYFSWMSDRLRFNDATLAQATKQLSHIYNVTFSWATDSLKTMSFSARFERESLKRTLEVIALTLSVDYQMKNHHVTWKIRETNVEV